jgi:hypothetical protein
MEGSPIITTELWSEQAWEFRPWVMDLRFLTHALTHLSECLPWGVTCTTVLNPIWLGQPLSLSAVLNQSHEGLPGMWKYRKPSVNLSQTIDAGTGREMRHCPGIKQEEADSPECMVELHCRGKREKGLAMVVELPTAHPSRATCPSPETALPAAELCVHAGPSLYYSVTQWGDFSVSPDTDLPSGLSWPAGGAQHTQSTGLVPKPDAEGGIHDATQIKVTSTQPAPSMSPCIVILLDEDFICNDAYYIVLSVVKLQIFSGMCDSPSAGSPCPLFPVHLLQNLSIRALT